MTELIAIDGLYPAAETGLTDEALLAELDHPALRANFVSSIDGAMTRDGLSGGLSGDADKRLFGLLRRVTDVVLVAAGTVRDEGYTAMRVDAASVQWREAHGKPAHPVFAIVSGALDLDEDAEIFTDAPVPPILFTTRAGAARASRFEGLAHVVIIGEHAPGRVDGAQVAEALRTLGHTRIQCEGGPTFLGALLAADAVDELCLTIEPTLEAGSSRRIAAGPSAPRSMRLARVLRAGETLLLRYARGDSPSVPMMLSSSGA
ncbi:riboflavin biosynthesis pyrimidine reductase [Leucobacter exalbidus]|uniref:Riboflavin biosynthesis pyrimidine reductase n=1 Tax=Leucobacter exalbidus TaxID=662960 RepID=A0A940PKK0_9MICO|nr:pyrimidine reductase family protein [Leucobacter exalbidus]MBP1324850.1 riboflavin biosynthesis pyrimidine reductase [Leucobacter exalbidus]